MVLPSPGFTLSLLPLCLINHLCWCCLVRKVLNPDGWGSRVAPWGLGFDPLVGWISGLIKKNPLAVPCPLSGSISCASPSGLGRCRVGSCSRPVSDGRLEFGGFLDRNLLVPWLLSHQWVVCALSAGPKQCRWGLSRSSFVDVAWLNDLHVCAWLLFTYFVFIYAPVVL
jgi:hypothetical protein